MDKLLTLENITAGYDTKTVLKDVSLTVREKDFLGIIGPNGGGKTTLLKVILGLLKPTSGTIAFFRHGRPVSDLKIGYLPQINKIDKRFPISVGEVIASGLMGQTKRLRGYSDGQKQRIEEVIAEMGLAALTKRPVGELSGGELQRVMLGRAIVSRPELLVLDEPNTYVDQSFESKLYERLREMNKETTVILVSHDMETIRTFAKNIAFVNASLRYGSEKDYR